jgi:hypothetical protein
MKLKLILTTAIAAAGVGGLLADQAAGLPTACSHSGRTVTCTYTSGSNPFTVPPGVFSIHVVAVGGRGASGEFSAGGSGAVVSVDLPVKQGSTLYVVVGANGGSASDVRTSQDDLSTRLLVAGGGGGGGGFGIAFLDGLRVSFSPGGNGGAAGDANFGGFGIDGGGGGSTSGGAGGAGITACFPIPTPFGEVCATSGSGSPGSFGFGGGGGNPGTWNIPGIVGFAGGGGGGGDGWFGGGGGAGGVGYGGGGGGGGGSNLVPPGGSQSVDTTGIPLITIAYIHGQPKG